MEVRYQPTAGDYWQSTLAWRKSTPWRKWAFRFLPLFCTFMFGLDSLAIWQHRAPNSEAYLLLAAGLIWIAFAWTRPRLNARRRAASLQGDVTVEVTQQGISFKSLGEESSVRWADFAGWAEGESVFALFLSSKTSIPVPKRAFTIEQMEDFREKLRHLITRG